MFDGVPILLAEVNILVIVGIIACVLIAGIGAIVVMIYGNLWFQAYMSRANVSHVGYASAYRRQAMI